MRALGWVAAVASWAVGVGGLFIWYIESVVVPMLPTLSARSQALATADVFLVVGAAGVLLNLAILVRGVRDARKEEAS